jgi:signal transduction histidine kinase
MSVSEPANLSTAPLELVQQALPVSTVDDLLRCLVDSWLRTSGATAGHVSLIANQKLSFAFAVPSRDDQPMFSSNDLPATTIDWSATIASDSLTSIVDKVAELPTTVTVVPFEFNGLAVGGAILLGDVEDSEVLAALATVSARLIEQLRSGQTSSSNLNPVSETRLRDLKLEAMAEFAAGAGHEINNPVATIAGRSALLLKTETDPERRRILETIGGQAYRIRDMIGDAMTYARPPEPSLEEFDPAAEITPIVDSLKRQFPHKNVAVEKSLDEAIRLNADREQFRVIVSCLIKNSLEAIDQEGVIRVELAMVDESGQMETRRVSEGQHQAPRIPRSRVGLLPHIRFTVSDNGVGLSEVEREHLFDPFYSGRQAGRGLGFGLSKCWQILRLHGGTIEAVDPSSDDDNSGNGLAINTLWPTE